MNEPHARILMVEDEPQVLEINSRMLRRRGYEVLTAQTAMEAYEQLDAGLPDLLILDILLPDGNGLDICRQFRKKCLRPVLFLTGKSDVKDKVAGLMEGGDYYLTKPCQFDEFLAVIQMLLAREQRLMENLSVLPSDHDQKPDAGSFHRACLSKRLRCRSDPNRIFSAASPCRTSGTDLFRKGIV